MNTAHYPLLLQLNTRVWLTARSEQLGRPVTLDDITNEDLEKIAKDGFDWVWLLSVWQTGPESRRVSRTNPEWLREFLETLPDLCDADIAGSGFAISSYTVHCDLGGDMASNSCLISSRTTWDLITRGSSNILSTLSKAPKRTERAAQKTFSSFSTEKHAAFSRTDAILTLRDGPIPRNWIIPIQTFKPQ
jgi:hypothetical protein